MVALIFFLLNLGASLFKPKSWLEAENAALRQQLVVLQRQVRGRVRFTNSDRLFFIQVYRWFPSVLKAMTIMRPETVMRWHRAGFRRWPATSIHDCPTGAASALEADHHAIGAHVVVVIAPVASRFRPATWSPAFYPQQPSARPQAAPRSFLGGLRRL